MVTNKQRGYIIQWLTWMKENGVFTTPSHRMSVKNWYVMYQHHNTPYSIALVKDLKTFTFHMSKICSEHMFLGLKKIIKRNPYEVYFEYKKEKDFSRFKRHSTSKYRASSSLEVGATNQDQNTMTQNITTENHLQPTSNASMFSCKYQ